MIRFYFFYKKCKNKVYNFFYKKSALYELKKVKANFHRDIRFIGPSTLNLSGQVNIGKGFICNSSINQCIDSGFSKIVVKHGAELNIGNYCGISNTILHCYNNIKIGNHVNIGAGTIIFDTNFHSLDWQDRADRNIDIQNAKTAPIHIGDYVFIGARCIIGKGVTIGEKSIVAAGSVVTKNIPAGEVWGGNPAKFIKKID